MSLDITFHAIECGVTTCPGYGESCQRWPSLINWSYYIILLCTYWEHYFPSMKKKVTDEKISTLQTASVTVWRIASYKVINIADPSKRKNSFHSLINNSSAESFSRLQLGKTSSHVENFKSQFRHCTINYEFKLNKPTFQHFQRLRLDVVYLCSNFQIICSFCFGNTSFGSQVYNHMDFSKLTIISK